MPLLNEYTFLCLIMAVLTFLTLKRGALSASYSIIWVFLFFSVIVITLVRASFENPLGIYDHIFGLFIGSQMLVALLILSYLSKVRAQIIATAQAISVENFFNSMKNKVHDSGN